VKKYILILLSLLGFKLSAQENLQGRLLTKDGSETIPLTGANVFWLNTQTGTVTDQEGKFTIPYLGPEEKLILSYIGFKSDTLSVQNGKLLIRFLKPSDTE